MEVMAVVPAEGVSRWDVEADVVVVGAGGCGVTAALAAGERGASVLLLDRDHRPVANTARSGGMIPAAGTRLQRAAGIEETPEQFAADILAKNHGQSDPEQTLHLARTAARVVDWLTERHHVRLELATDFLYPGHTQYRMHCPPERTGAALLADLKRAAREVPTIQYVPDVRVENLVAAESGAVVGVVADSGRRELVRARKVILACNGFGANAAMVREFCPEAADALYFGGPGSTGEGIQWGMALGAQVAFMDSYQLHATVAQPGEVLVSYSITMEGGFHVNVRGERFADETRGYSEHALDVLAQPGRTVVVVYDARLHRLGRAFPDYRACVEAGLVKQAPTIEALGAAFRLDGAALARTLEDYRRGREAGRDRFGRRTFADLQPPFFGIRVTGALLHTQGGLVVDREARVLRADGTPIPNLYAGGGVAAGISGHGAGGYLSGNGLLTALGYGYLAGRHAAASLGFLGAG
ncbi:MAG: FAD-dependent oxidoreductase [Chloroflexota bacterium]|nr:FAD-dependent oxidoreductase [Dehalococcoidia bacterium]MDW8252492.1 FAD-dependent oxidoreductase [Chloroflexota bacterium]